MSNERNIFFKPEGGWVGDVIPFYKDGTYWLYYLHDRRTTGGQLDGTSWHLATSSDFVTYRYHGEILKHGGADEQDLNAYTGSIMEAEGRYHLFYTGYNPAVKHPVGGLPVQSVMHAVSDDLLSWQKMPEDTFYAAEGLYEPYDWRDPFVFYEPESRRYWMLLAARGTSGLARRRGCIALCTSADLTLWRPEQPFWAPQLYITHECPDLFRIGDWWYLVYSEFSERFTTRYRMSRQLAGPWIAPAEDALDGRAYYAAKTAGDDAHRYAFGWIATRVGEADGGDWQWAGQLAVHEVVQQPDGALTVNLPGTIRSAFSAEIPAAPLPATGDWETSPGRLAASAPDSFATALGPNLPQQCLISTTITFAAGTRGCGVLLRAAGDAGYYIRLEPQRGRLVFDRWPRRPEGSMQWQIDGDVPHALELERVVELEAGKPHSLQILIEGAICIVYLDGIVAMSARLYDRSDGQWGFFASEGVVEFRDFAVRTM